MNKPPNRRIHLDSSVYIAFQKGETIQAAGGLGRAELARMIFQAAEVGRIAVFTSTASLVEVRHGVEFSSLSADARYRLIDQLFERSLTTFVEVDRDVALLARQIAVEYGIKTLDAIQIASARPAGCHELFIWDKNVVRKFTSNPLADLRVSDPYWEGQMGLPS